MNRRLKIGIDVHSTNYSLCAMKPVVGEENRIFATLKVTLDYKYDIQGGLSGIFLI